jgi:pantoate--beta-alanine ligase
MAADPPHEIRTPPPRFRGGPGEAPLRIATPAALRSWSEAARAGGLLVGLVPTMGALHAGHVSLVRRARQECDRTAVSIFVNPLQFTPGEDFERYPRRLDADLEVLRAEGVDAAYLPAVETMYPPDATTRVRVAELDEVLEGACRPGHFEGVATVVLKLFEAARPHRAYFGQKDAQQAAVVTRLARDLDTGVEVVVCPTVREPNGLALSSRNAYLGGDERRAALCLVRALRAANERYAAGERDAAPLRAAMHEALAAEPLARVDYAEVVDEGAFRPPGRLAVLAVRVGATRLIDNHWLGDPL